MNTVLFAKLYRFVFLLGLVVAQLSAVAQDFVLYNQADVDAFDPNITVINGNFTIDGADITDLSNLSNLISIDGYLDISLNSSLQNLNGLTNLTNVGEYVYIFFNSSLQNLDGFANLTSIGGRLSIVSNNSLTNLDGLINLASVGGKLNVTKNNSLTNCCGIQELLENQTSSIAGSISIFDNPSECSSEEEVLVTICKNYIYGNVFYDSNLNKIQDANEFGVSTVKIISQQGTNQSITNNIGRFLRKVEEGVSYDLEIEIKDNWQLTTDQSVFNFTFDPDNKPDISFGLYHPDQISSSKINITSEATRCNTGVEYYISLKNDGFAPLPGELKLMLSENAGFIFSDIDFAQDGQELTLEFDTLYPFQTLEFTMLLDMPSEQSTGDVITVSGEVYYDEPEGTVLKDETTYESIVLCSYDPNDKQVSPAGIKAENYTLKDSELQYTVRFQNTGNAPAIDVRILDTLDENLDLETFKVTQSSFPVFTSIKDRAVEFYFQDIWLVDSLSNEPESHGYISYNISPKEGLEDLTEIENKAHIIFDFNPAIITNTTSNSLVDEICEDKMIDLEVTICEGEDYFGLTEAGLYELEESIGVTCDSFTTLELTVLPADDPLCVVSTNDEDLPSLIISPNPFHDELQVMLSDGKIKQVTLYDIQGRIVKQYSSNLTKIETKNLYKGLYILEVVTDKGDHLIQKVVKE